jgi:GH15 family glucan-1,4-alpha-glucosidase
MDLYSAVRRLEHPFVFEVGEDPEVPLDARGMIGDGNTVALVRVDGAIDWLCLPRFDSPSVFGALLDRERGGASAITPVKRPFTSLQAYDPGTNVLETMFVVPGQGAVRLVDFMPWSDDPRAAIHEIHRRIEGLEGRVELELTFDPRFDYGRAPPELEIQEHGVLARGRQGERFVAVGAAAPWQRTANGVAQRLSVAAGDRKWMVLSWDAVAPESIARYRSFEHLRVTRRAWRAWSNRLNYDGPWRHHVLRSALCLKLLTYAPTGAMVAAPTTSLPEWIGGQRNWDYRYTWVRDASFAIRAENLLGYVDEAREFFHFVRDAVDAERGLEIMYTIDGGPVPEEEVLAHLVGHRGTGPVRIGNGARSQVQLDTTGALVDAAHLYERFGNALTLRSWRKIRQLVETARKSLHLPDHGIWEPRSGPRHNVHSKTMQWVALDRGAGIAAAFGDQKCAHAWSLDAVRLRSEILQHGLDPTGTHFTAAYGDRHVDAALLTLPLYGLISEDDPRLAATVARIRDELGDGQFLYRYRHDLGHDGVGGAEGAFVLCGFWLAEVLALMGRLDEAQEVFVAHARASNHAGLLAEEIDPRTRTNLGNFPQSFSHLGLINAALRIDLGLRLRDEGSHEVPHLISNALRRSTRNSRNW